MMSEGIKSEAKNAVDMFASVWIKEEVANSDEERVCNLICEEEPLNELRKPKNKKKKKPRKKLNCDVCDYTTVYRNCLKLHIMSHDDTKAFMCEFCDYTTKYPTSLQRHILVRHEDPHSTKGVPLYKCDQCTYVSAYKWNLSSHKRKHKLEKQFKCLQCPYETAYRHNYIKHNKTHSEIVAFKCDKCPFVTKYEGHITRHLAKIHNEVTEKANKCDVCDFATKLKWRLNIHRQRSKQDSLLKCGYCDFETFFTCESKKHKITHFTEIYGVPKASNINTPICTMKDNQNFTQISGINIDVGASMNNEDSNNQQPHSSNKYTLDKNCISWKSIQVLESDDKDRPFQCYNCTYTSRFKASVQRHYQRHHTGSDNRPYKCLHCDFSTKTKDQIALHNKRSQSEILVFCEKCDFKSFFKCQLIVHQKIHFAFKCTICEHPCRHKYELQKHYAAVHLGNGMKCRFCDYKSSRKESVLCHETIHTGEKPFKCELCVYSSVRKSLLDNHVKRYHSEVKNYVTVVSESKIESLKILQRPDQLQNFSSEVASVDK